jgi:hypothetical protein
MDELLLLRPKRAKILAAPPPPPPEPPHTPQPLSQHPWAAAALGLCGLLVVVAIASWLAKAPQTGQAPKPAALQSEPTATLAQAPAASEEVPAAPRAVLVPVPVRRAALFRLPGQELGVYQSYQLPVAWGGGSVWARYMGTVEHFSQIPPGPVPGDLWNVIETENSWIFCTPIGYDHAMWIDP